MIRPFWDIPSVLKIWENLLQDYMIRANQQENLEVEADKKGPYSLHSEVEKVIKMWDKKATWDDVPRDILKVLGKDELILMTHLINNIHKAGEWLKDFNEVTNCLKEAVKGYKMQQS